MIKLTWAQIYERISKIRLEVPPDRKFYGIPRGGAIVAGLTGRPAERPEDAHYLIDDIIDSGRTREKWTRLYPGKEFFSLWDKTNGDPREWVQFPWEYEGLKEIEDTVVRQLEYIGEDPAREGLLETPSRVIKALGELTTGYQDDPEKILAKVFTQPYDEMVVLKDIEFWSLCEHHMLPFHGRIGIGYVPRGKIVGISKLARLVKCYSRRLQVQERMTQEIATAIDRHLKPLGVGVIAQATHLCMAMRGVEEPASMVTSCLLGVMREKARPEFLRLFDGKL